MSGSDRRGSDRHGSDRDPDFLEWVAEARAGDFHLALSLNGFTPARGRGKGHEWSGPCPACGGTKRFNVHLVKRKWFCRDCDLKGADALSLALVGERVSFVEACEALSGRARPARVRAESEEQRQERAARRRALDDRIAAERAKAAAKAAAFRERERQACAEIWRRGLPCTSAASVARAYFAARGLAWPRTVNLRELADLPYFHGDEEDGRGGRRARVVWRGPAMLARILDNAGAPIGLHITWLKPDGSGKATIICPETGEVLPPKKMRGSKKGGHIVVRDPSRDPDSGAPAAARLFIAEGIENVASVGTALHRAHLLRPDDALWAAGDLGNLGGPHAGLVTHPHVLGATGRRMRVPGPEPKPETPDDPAIAIPDSVSSVVIVGDGDSDPFSTMQHLERARRRWLRPGLSIAIAMPPPGSDFNSMITRGSDV